MHTCTGTEAVAVGIYVFCLVECQTPRGGSGLLCTCVPFGLGTPVGTAGWMKVTVTLRMY